MRSFKLSGTCGYMFRIDEAGYVIKDYKDIAAMSRHNGLMAVCVCCKIVWLAYFSSNEDESFYDKHTSLHQY